MATEDTTTLTDIINDQFSSEIQSSINDNTQLFQLFPPVSAESYSEGSGDSIRWTVELTEDDNSEEYVEGTPIPVPSNIGINKAAVGKTHYHNAAKITGISLDFLKNNKVDLTSPFGRTIMKSGMQLQRKINTGMLAALQAAIDSTGTYAGIDRSTYPLWASSEEATSTALTLAQVNDQIRILKSAPRGVDFNNLRILLPPELGQAFGDLRTADTNRPFNTSRASANDMDGGNLYVEGGGLPPYNGIPVIEVQEMTATNVLIVDVTKIAIVETRPVTIVDKTQGVMEDAELRYLTAAYNIIVENPYHCAKLSNKTAA